MIQAISIFGIPIIITIIIGAIVIKYVKWDERKRRERRIKREAEELYLKMKLIEEMKKR